MRSLLQYLSRITEILFNFSQRVRAFMAQKGILGFARLLTVSGVMAAVVRLFATVFKSGIQATLSLVDASATAPQLQISLGSNPLTRHIVAQWDGITSAIDEAVGPVAGWAVWFFGVDWLMWLASMAFGLWACGQVIKLVELGIQALFGIVRKVMP